jgi:SAM-dependent methyltransferase
MPVLVRQCSLDRRPWPRRALSPVTRPLTRYLSEQAARPHGVGGPLIGRLWVKETAKTNDAAFDLLAPGPGEDVLEIGFGPGRTLGLLAERGARVTGVDVSEEMVRLAGRRNAELVRTGDLTLHRGDGVMLPVQDNSQDAVLSVHNLYFWPEPEATIAEIARVLRPEGRFILVFRGREHPLPSRLDPAIYRDVTTERCIAWLVQAGFDARCHRPNGVPAEVSYVLATLSPDGVGDRGAGSGR